MIRQAASSLITRFFAALPGHSKRFDRLVWALRSMQYTDKRRTVRRGYCVVQILYQRSG
jgi:hypothetical protein